MQQFFSTEDSRRMGKIAMVAGIALAFLIGMKFINEVRRYGTIEPNTLNTIDVNGQGEAFAIPDIAVESFTIEAKGTTVAEAQKIVNEKMNVALAFLKKSDIAEKDIKTQNYSAYPEYIYPCQTGPCPEGVSRTPKISGYTVSQSVSVKVRDTAKVGDVIDGLGKAGATGLSGPDYTVDNPDSVKNEARAKAIADAEAKARVLARTLHVRLVRIVRYSENQGGNYPMPIYEKAAMGMGSADATSAQLPAGENKYSSNVTVTYEIR